MAYSAREPEGTKAFRVDGQGIRSRSEGSTDGEDYSSDSPSRLSSASGGSAENSEVVRQVMAVNKDLLQKIDILRLRLQIDRKHDDDKKKNIGTSREQQIDKKTGELSSLKNKLQEKDKALSQLGEMNKRKTKEVVFLEKNINDLKREVQESRLRAQDLQNEIAKLQKEREASSQHVDAKQRDKEIKMLENEINKLRNNLDTMEKELLRANELITKQGARIVLLENENINMQTKFKEDVNKMAANMRFEIEKMRDVMKRQNDEMRGLRQQNEEMGKDIRDIKMLLSPPDGVTTKQENVKSPRRMNVLNPSLPALTKDKRNGNRLNRR